MLTGFPLISVCSDGRGVLSSPQTGGMFYTPDFGRSWKPAGNLEHGFAQDIVVHSSGLGLAAFRIGVAISSDYGQTWRMHSRSGDVQAVAISSDGTGCVVYADGTLLITRDQGGNWDEMSLGLAGEVQRACFDQRGRCYILFQHIFPDPNIPEETIRHTAYEIWLSTKYSSQPQSELENWFEAQRRTSRRAELLRSDDHCRSWLTDFALRDVQDAAMNSYQERVALLIPGLELRHRAHPEDSWQAVSTPDLKRPADAYEPVDIHLLSHKTWGSGSKCAEIYSSVLYARY
jgi:hypothetical protein